MVESDNVIEFIIKKVDIVYLSASLCHVVHVVWDEVNHNTYVQDVIVSKVANVLEDRERLLVPPYDLVIHFQDMKLILIRYLLLIYRIDQVHVLDHSDYEPLAWIISEVDKLGERETDCVSLVDHFQVFPRFLIVYCDQLI